MTPWVVLATALVVLATSIIAMHERKKTNKQLVEIHVMLDGQASEAREYKELLLRTLRQAGVDVPPDAAALPTGE